MQSNEDVFTQPSAESVSMPEIRLNISPENLELLQLYVNRNNIGVEMYESTARNYVDFVCQVSIKMILLSVTFVLFLQSQSSILQRGQFYIHV